MKNSEATETSAIFWNTDVSEIKVGDVVMSSTMMFVGRVDFVEAVNDKSGHDKRRVFMSFVSGDRKAWSSYNSEVHAVGEGTGVARA